MELRGFAAEYGRLVAGWASTAQEVALLCGREEYPFPEELTGSWRKVAPDIQSGAGFVDVSQQEMDDWNAGQSLAYRWMRYADTD